jgi:hypothetical protein
VTTDHEVPVAQEWFVHQRVVDGPTLVTEPHVHPLLRCKVWLVPSGAFAKWQGGFRHREPNG